MVACHAADDRQLIVNGTDLSPWVTKVSLTQKADTYECTTTQDQYKTFHAGKPTAELKVSFIQDYAAGAVSRTLEAVFGKSVSVTAKPKVDGTTKWVGEFVITETVPIPDGTGDDVAEFDVTWPLSGQLVATP